MSIKIYLLLFMDEFESVNRIIFFLISDRREQIEFSSNDSVEDVKELFLTAAEANSENILKLYDSRGNVLSISNRLSSNNSEQRYRLNVYSMIVNSYTSNDKFSQEKKINFDLKSFETRSSRLFLKKFKFASSERTLNQLINRLSILESQFELLDFMTWMGFKKDLSEIPLLKYFWNKESTMQLPDEHISCVYQNFLKMGSHPNSNHLKTVKLFKFNNWSHTESSLLYFVRQIFIDLRFMETFKIPVFVFENWLKNIYIGYNNVPYHNFKHAFIVTQMMYSFFFQLELTNGFDKLTQFSLIVASLCHDLDHPGFNNNFLINSRSTLALRYNDFSPLENNHCFLTFKILTIPDCNIMANLSLDDYKIVRQYIIKCILATDMLYHNKIISTFLKELPNFSFSDPQNKEILMKILIKLADIGVECKPVESSYHWPLKLVTEFTNQADIEKMLNIPLSQYMYRDTAYKNSTQLSFLSKILLPLVLAVAQLFPVINTSLLDELQKKIALYTDFADSLM